MAIPSIGQTKSKKPEPVVVGALLPMSGPLSVFGEQARVGIELAVDSINTNGGINGRRLKLSLFDTRTETDVAVRGSLELLRRQKVIAVIGPITSSARNAVLPLHIKHRTPLLYATNYEGGRCNRYLFGFNTVPSQELAVLLPGLVSQIGKRVYLIGNDYAWPRRSFKQARRLIRKHGGKVVGEEYLPFGTDQFDALIARVREAQADIVIKAVPGAEGIALANQLNQFGQGQAPAPVAIAYLGFSEIYLSGINRDVSSNIWVAAPFFQSLDTPLAKRFVDAARDRADQGIVVSHYMVTHYNAMIALAQALRKKGKVNRAGLIKRLTGLKVTSVAGAFTIGRKSRHAVLPMFLAQAGQDGLEIVQRLDSVEPVNVCK